MKEKKTAVITFRTEEWVKETLEVAAKQNGWSVAQTVNQLCKNFVINPYPNEIIVKTKKLLEITEELIKEGEETGTKISIDIEEDPEQGTLKKVTNFFVLESGGLGCIEGFEDLPEMTEDEILDIP